MSDLRKEWIKAIIAILFITIGVCAFAQEPVKATTGYNAIRDASGNFNAIASEKAKVDSTTTFTFTDAKGVKHPVYSSPRGKYYVSKVSKSGNRYRYYLSYQVTNGVVTGVSKPVN